MTERLKLTLLKFKFACGKICAIIYSINCMESNLSDISCFFMGKMVPLYGRRLLVITASLIKLITFFNVGCGLTSRLSSVTIYHQSGHFQ